MKLQKFTLKGMMTLQSYLEKHRSTSDPYIDITDYESEEIYYNEKYIEIDKKKSFTNKLSVGKYFLHIFPENFLPDIETWNWLSILYYRQLLNKQRKIGELQRIFISKNISYYPYNHLLKAPYDICKFYKIGNRLNEVEFLLLDAVNVNSTLYTEVIKRQDIMKNPTFLEVARKLFYDEDIKSFKKRIGKDVPRLIKIWKQYERGFDMYRMPSQEILNKLLVKHSEFKEFI